MEVLWDHVIPYWYLEVPPLLMLMNSPSMKNQVINSTSHTKYYKPKLNFYLSYLTAMASQKLHLIHPILICYGPDLIPNLVKYILRTESKFAFLLFCWIWVIKKVKKLFYSCRCFVFITIFWRLQYCFSHLLKLII